MQIRAYITDLLQQIDNDSALIPNLKLMRAACRKYLDDNPKSDKRHRYFGPEDTISLGELRGVFGINLAEICVKFGVDLDSELEDILRLKGFRLFSLNSCNAESCIELICSLL